MTDLAEPPECWSMWVDLEGYSGILEQNELQAIMAFNDLLDALVRIGTELGSELATRFCACQLGDGFFVVDEGAGGPTEEPPPVDLPLSIAVLLQRAVLLGGNLVAKASITAGEFADIQGCYSKAVRESLARSPSHQYIDLGLGRVYLTHTTGTGLSRSFKLSQAKTGALLIVGGPLAGMVRKHGWIVTHRNRINSRSRYVVVDWIHSDPPQLQELARRCDLGYLGPGLCHEVLKHYLEHNARVAPTRWRTNTARLNGIDI